MARFWGDPPNAASGTTQPGSALRPDARSLTAASLCVLALFFDFFGWLLAIAGMVLLRRAGFSRTVKWCLAALAIGPKILFLGVRSLNAPAGLSFPIEPRNLATSSSLWVWCIFLVAAGVYLIVQSRRLPQDPKAPVQPHSYRWLLVAALGVVSIVGAAVLLLGLTEGFHWINDAGRGQWALRHAARGNVAVFNGSDVQFIGATEWYSSRGGTSYSIQVALAGGRSFSVRTKSAAALDELRRFATTANLPEGKMRIVRRRGGVWTNGATGFTLKDFIGTYQAAGADGPSRSTFEFWLDGERLAGKETVAGPQGNRVRVLRNIKVSDNGDFEFQAAPYIEVGRQDKGTVSLSFGWSPQVETGRFVRNGLEVGLQKYSRFNPNR